MKDKHKPIAAITIGDINGIGPEIILRVFSDTRLLDFCTPVLYGPVKVIEYYKKSLHLPDIPLNTIRDLSQIKKNKINILDCDSAEFEIEAGKSTSAAGEVAFKALKMAVDDVLEGEAELLVTAPLNKKNITSFHENFTGHTGYLSERDGNEALMILCSEKLKVAMVTTHVPLKDVHNYITEEIIISRIEEFHKSLKMDFGIDRPKIAVLGFNPHAGEEGLLGKEEIDVIGPAISQAKTKGIIAVGPYPADGFFGSANYTNFDGVLAMYHDQALIPFKTLSFENGVNFSSGLSFIRTSPDHGTAYEIAGKGRAAESSLREAIFMACDIFHRRHEELILTEGQEV